MRYIFSGQYSRFWLSIYQITAEKYFLFKMLITFEPKVAQRSVASQNDLLQYLLCIGAFKGACGTCDRSLFTSLFLGTSTALKPEMEKHADTADISVLFFLWLC